MGQETCGECSGLALAVIPEPDHTDGRGRTRVTFGCRNAELRDGTNNSYTRLYSPGLNCTGSAIRRTWVPILAPPLRQVNLLNLGHIGKRKTDRIRVV